MTSSGEDPLLRSARREAYVAFGLWVAALVYSVTYCGLRGYGRTADDLTFVFGFPDWVFWGIVLPWCLCTALSIAFAYGFMTDEPLEEDPPEVLAESPTGGGNAVPSTTVGSEVHGG
jgi:hypothetical protein